MYFAQLDQPISHDDILPFTSLLKTIGKVENLDLIIHSPGGDGIAADKMMDLCRKYCSAKLRVVVPLYAKSAATLMALSGDEIIMGETSEIGPIDGQVFIIQDNARQQVSADHFLRAASEAKKQLTSSDDGEVEAARIQMMNLSPAFLQHCKDVQEFSKQFAVRQLTAHMFAAERIEDPAVWDKKISLVVENLLSSGTHLTHGKMITVADIAKDKDLSCLKITALTDTDPYWLALDDLLERTDVVAKTRDLSKVLMASDFHMVGGPK
jgi:ATP-dependent protease ClpP protease subunit